MLAIIVHFESKPDQIDAFKKEIIAHATRCLEREPGCLQFDGLTAKRELHLLDLVAGGKPKR
jgi:quinol monooxygenase YgiN